MAFIRSKTFKGSDGKRVYYYIVEGRREEGKTKQKVIKYIGTIETLIKKLEIADQVLKKKCH